MLGALLALVLFAPPVFAADLGDKVPALLDDEPEFLSADEAFVFSAEVGDDGALRAHWQMPDGYYLYRHRFEFSVPAGSPVRTRRRRDPTGQSQKRRILR